MFNSLSLACGQNEINGFFLEKDLNLKGDFYTTYKFSYSIEYEVTSKSTFEIEEGDAEMKISAQYGPSDEVEPEPDLKVILQKKDGVFNWKNVSTKYIKVDEEEKKLSWTDLEKGKYRFILHKPMNDGYIIQNVDYPEENCSFSYK